jgi:hypothetical protein
MRPANTCTTAAGQRVLEEIHIRLDHFHPLEVIPLFRRWPASLPRDLIYTFIFSGLIALMFLAIWVMVGGFRGWHRLLAQFQGQLLAACVIGYTFHLAYALLAPFTRWLNRQREWLVYAGYLAIGWGVYLLGTALATQLPGLENWQRVLWTPQWLVASFMISAVISLIILYAFRSRVSELVREAEVSEARLRESALNEHIALANLKVLQAQIEPHFLFNTLANVSSLIDAHPGEAKAMLTALNELLRASLKQTRAERTTLGDELDLIRHYLTILKIRMGDRLAFSVTADDADRGINVPPFLLQPLVENAIRHGIEPRIEGGRVDVRAERGPAGLTLTVTDTGQGFAAAGAAASAGTGVGLDNVRRRLAGAFGVRARFTVRDHVPHGTHIELLLPDPK